MTQETENSRERRLSELQLDRLIEWRKQAEAHLAATDLSLVTLRVETLLEIKMLRDERDNALKWGILTLGGAVIGMGAWIWNFVTGHIR